MMCNYPRCFKEAVGRATDAFGSNDYCEKHLSEVEGLHGIKVIRFGKGSKQVEKSYT